MLDFHKSKNADITLATIPVPIEEANRFGVAITDENKRITEFEEKPEKPRSNLASMGIYIFTWKVLKDALIALWSQKGCDFGKHIIPYCHQKGDRVFAYEYNGYWKDVGTLGSYWESNMELIDLVPEFNLYEEFWRIYTKADTIPPGYIADTASVNKAIIGEGTEVYGEVHSSVIGSGVTIGSGAVIRDSIIMKDVVVEAGVLIDKSIIAEGAVIGANTQLGVGEEVPNKLYPNIYSFGLVTVAEKTQIPSGVKIGKNTAIEGITLPEDYPNGVLESGETLIKAGDRL
jgi:glucose-1-phosphate adenylyltransferase